MDKKLFGIKLSTYVNFFVCFVIAFIVWVVAKYIEVSSTESAVVDFLSSGIYL